MYSFGENKSINSDFNVVYKYCWWRIIRLNSYNWLFFVELKTIHFLVVRMFKNIGIWLLLDYTFNVTEIEAN